MAILNFVGQGTVNHDLNKMNFYVPHHLNITYIVTYFLKGNMIFRRVHLQQFFSCQNENQSYVVQVSKHDSSRPMEIDPKMRFWNQNGLKKY